MYKKQSIDDCIQRLEEYELAIATLYDAFTDILPRYAGIWTSFADEERQHAAWMRKLHGYVIEGRLPLEQTKITTQAALAAIAHIEKQREKVLRDRSDLDTCLNIAINVEKTLLEGAFFKVFRLTAPEAQKIRAQLEAATKSHLKRLLEWQGRNIVASIEIGRRGRQEPME